jgi:hypothetical protein
MAGGGNRANRGSRLDGQSRKAGGGEPRGKKQRKEDVVDEGQTSAEEVDDEEDDGRAVVVVALYRQANKKALGLACFDEETCSISVSQMIGEG